LIFFLVRFWAFLGKGSSKTPQEGFGKKSVSKTSQNFDQNFNVSFSSTSFVLSHFRVFFSDGSSKTLQKTFYKNRVEKFLQKNRPEVQNRLFLDFLYHVFGRFSVRGVQKHDKKKYQKNKSDLFCPLTHPPPTGGTDFVVSSFEILC
jgi:hypothetical protein